jgi:hypothetical protein
MLGVLLLLLPARCFPVAMRARLHFTRCGGTSKVLSCHDAVMVTIAAVAVCHGASSKKTDTLTRRSAEPFSLEQR